jgi:hypothetical protein
MGSWIPVSTPKDQRIITSGYRQEVLPNTLAIVYGFSNQNGHYGPSEPRVFE